MIHAENILFEKFAEQYEAWFAENRVAKEILGLDSQDDEKIVYRWNILSDLTDQALATLQVGGAPFLWQKFKGGLKCQSMSIDAGHVRPHPSISSVWERMKQFFAKNAEAPRWREYYPLLPLWVEYLNILQAGPAAVVQNAARPLPALMEAPADGIKHADRR